MGLENELDASALDRVRMRVVLSMLQSEQYSARMFGLRELEHLVDAQSALTYSQGYSRSTFGSFGNTVSNTFSNILGTGGAGAAPPLPTLLCNVPQDVHKMEVPLFLPLGEFDRWLSENRVLLLTLQGNLDQSHYFERVKPLVEFLASKFTREEIKLIWSLQVCSSFIVAILFSPYFLLGLQLLCSSFFHIFS